MSTGNRILVSLLGAAMFCCVTAPDALAQRGRGFGYGPNRAQLATLKEVQEALKLNDEQKQIARDAVDHFNREVGELFMTAMGDVEKVRLAMPAIHDRATAKINEKVNEAQRRRLTELFVQQNGVNSVFDPQVKALLRLTDEQVAALQTARNTNREEGAKATRQMPKGETRAQRTERFEKLWKEAEERILSILTEKQTETFKKLHGEEMQIDLRPLFPPPPPPFNPNRDFNM
jgi:hypothetical protein